jgi:D-glycero-alpha-D-manno-heptose-7-phosphate kinase
LPVRVVTAVAPIRIADLGGWTDTWFAGHGLVCNIAVRPGVEVRIEVRDGRGGVDIEAANPLLSAAVEEVGTPASCDVRIGVHSVIPPGASTGTSAAVTVALLGALTFLRDDGRFDGAEVAAAAHRVEAERLGRQSGIQDQLASAHGGINRIEMTSYPVAEVTRVATSASTRRDLGARLLLVYLGRAHVSSDVHAQVIAELEGAPAPEVDRRLAPLRAAAEAGCLALEAGDLEAYGAALVANSRAQEALHPSLVGADARRLFTLAAELGASGWKVNGAGGDGGSVTILCRAGDGTDELAHAARSLDAGYVPIATTLDEDGLRVSSTTSLE